MARVFITGSADGLGRGAAQTLLDDGHQVIVHVRNTDRLAAVRDLADDEWPRMLCVETCNVRAAGVRLGPGDRHTMTATIQVRRG